jgi:hypothetical protein
MTYGELVRARKDCRLCVDGSSSGLRNGSSFEFDPDVVSHWSQWLGHQRPRLLVVGQDFSGVDYFEKNLGRDDPECKTNRCLRYLLAAAGIEVSLPPEPDPAAAVYLTNSVLCMKSGKMSGAPRVAWVRNCTQFHLVPLLDQLQPRVVVAMGASAWRAVREVFPGTGLPSGIKEAAGMSWTSPTGAVVVPVVHCGRKGLACRPLQQQLADWRVIGRFVADTIER